MSSSKPSNLKVEEEESKSNEDNKLTKTPLIYSQQSPSHRNILGSPILESQQYNIFKPDLYTNGKDKLYKYDYNDLHSDLEKQHFCGVYGWDNACYWGIAEKKAGTDLTKHYTKRHSVKFI